MLPKCSERTNERIKALIQHFNDERNIMENESLSLLKGYMNLNKSHFAYMCIFCVLRLLYGVI